LEALEIPLQLHHLKEATEVMVAQILQIQIQEEVVEGLLLLEKMEKMLVVAMVELELLLQ
jgi:hypothetical protein